MNAAEYEPALLQGWMIARLVSDMPLAAMVAHAERADAIGPLLDPSLWLKKKKPLGEDLDMLRALRTFQAAVALIGARHDARVDELRARVEPVRTCRACGCTDDRACEGGCSWIAQDLCSRCAVITG